MIIVVDSLSRFPKKSWDEFQSVYEELILEQTEC